MSDGEIYDEEEDLTQDPVDMLTLDAGFEYLHPNKVGVWLFDCSSAHKGLAMDTLNVNNMNVTRVASKSTYSQPPSHSTIPHPNLDILTHVACHKTWSILTTIQLLNYGASPRA
jgi:hypothetical protein